MYTNNRDAYRQAFFTVWQKYQKKLPLDATEAQLVEVIALHPEYHALLENPAAYQQQEFELEENPLLHMSLHIALREQIRTNRPAGIAAIYDQLLEKLIHAHDVDHHMMACLSQMIWKAQQTGEAPDESEYLRLLNFI